MLPFVMFGGIVLAILAVLVLVARMLAAQRRHARQAGYPSFGAYLAASPRTDEEKRHAADLALKGLVICLLGTLFPPLILLGLFPFFYGARKLVWAWMGLGLMDDGIDPQAPQAH